MKLTGISESPLFRNISIREVESMMHCLSAVKKPYKKGEMIFCAGDTAKMMAMVLSGSVEILHDDVWGNRQIMGTSYAGDLFGESYACMPGETFMVSARAAEDSEILFMEVGRILTTCSSACEFHNRLIHNLLYVLASNNLRLTRKIEHMGRRSIREKVMAYLSFQAEKRKTDTFEIPFNRQQLADYLAVDRSALSAELSRMKKDGIIAFEKNRFSIQTKA